MVIFDNCIIQAPDGVNLSRCGSKKLQWYINNGLADLVGNNPPTIRLRFEPSGRQGLEDPLLLDGKPNVCVVCGSSEDLTRHHIVPYSFVKYMEIEYKVDVIRDIFPLCRECHNDYEKKSQEKRKDMAEKFGVPLFGIDTDEIRTVRRAMGAASALLKYGARIPTERKEYLLNQIREFLGKPVITEEDLLAVKRYKITRREDYVNFSKYVAQNMQDYSEFAKEWRTHFVDTMQPRFMPSNWRIDRITKNVWIPKKLLNQQSRQQ